MCELMPKHFLGGGWGADGGSQGEGFGFGLELGGRALAAPCAGSVRQGHVVTSGMLS